LLGSFVDVIFTAAMSLSELASNVTANSYAHRSARADSNCDRQSAFRRRFRSWR